ncbi:DUF1800 domain-containing protein [uncultured Paraglaciecola sp.]|uniref:DUF1800 domain-containing protein n=1 Tax=uncultured Paraglaciecola sp. TaxID=1765024 RepID=UPI0025FDFAE8|nr:DUF1800 domain-containing protein [uncultured Paraglaciecola sp.]
MSKLSTQQASHLARRAGFSANNNQLERLASANSLEEAIEQLLTQSPSLLALPQWHNETPTGRVEDATLRQQLARQRRNMGKELKFWWFQQMVSNTSSLQEKATLFWANHFTSSLEKVKWAPAMLQQNLSLREHALGSFRDMLKAMLRDPAMLKYLDNANSKKQSPNENLSRELLELFTMGEGHYSEQDVKELARALTGASVDRQTGKYVFRRGIHDNGSKTIFGESANFGPDDVADLILRQPQVASFITDKLWCFFVDEQPDMAVIATLSNSFVQSDYDLAELLKAIFLQDAFWSAQGGQIKSPMELVVGSMQLFDTAMLSQQQVLKISGNMGQDLFSPPHVKGWPGGKAWYSSGNLAMRERAASFFAKRASFTPDIAQLLATDAVGNLPATDDSDYLVAVLSDPAFQVV